ncbi:MAG: hypothetical protein U9O53_02630 [archaeon]|nr:hypothetical protein [archaeon]
MEIDFVSELRYAREDSLKHLTSFIKNPEVYTIENFKVLTPRSFTNIFNGYNRSQDTIVLSPDTVYDEIKRLENMTKSDDPSILAKFGHYASIITSPIDDILSIPLNKGLKSVDAGLTAEEINRQQKKNIIKTVASAVPGLCLFAGAAIYYCNNDIETASALFTASGVYLIADIATYSSYLFGNTVMYGYLLAEKEADNLFNEIKDCKVLLND